MPGVFAYEHALIARSAMGPVLRGGADIDRRNRSCEKCAVSAAARHQPKDEYGRCRGGFGGETTASRGRTRIQHASRTNRHGSARRIAGRREVFRMHQAGQGLQMRT